MVDYTKIIRNLRADEINLIVEERDNAPQHFWGPHTKTPSKTALKDGLSLYLQQFSEGKKLEYNRFEIFPNTIKFLQSLYKGKLARIYWHCLEPNQKIQKHKDNLLKIGYKDIKFLTRYQIYLEVPKNVVLVLDDSLVKDPSIYTNTIVEFALEKPHYYCNASNQTFYILVFDFVEW